MKWTNVVARFDKGVGNAAERTVRTMNRRTALRGAMLGGAATAAALALGQSPAGAITCDCGPTRRCSACDTGGTCPSKWSLCTPSNSCTNIDGYNCIYPLGYWIACSGYGTCGNGYRRCYDCVNGTDCRHWCTCLSDIICGGCCSPADVKAEQLREQRQLAAMS